MYLCIQWLVERRICLIYKKDCVKNMQIALILGCWSMLVHADSVILPTIYWDPINPLFACENTIQVDYDDVLNFKCRDSSTPYSQSIDDTDILYENAYFLGTNQYMYNTCNATGASEQILNCNGGTNSIDSYKMTFSKYSPSGKLTFKDGETYYIIGTGFRVQSNLANLINGSCNKVDTRGQYKLRLKIYVCSLKETCKKCSSDACYFKDCQVDCTSWETSYSQLINSNNSCVSLQTRTCTNQLIGTVSIEKREIPITCPTLSTSTVSTLPTSTIPTLSTSTVPSLSTSTTQSVSSRAASLINQNNSQMKLTYIMIFTIVFVFLFGISLGIAFHKKLYNRKFETSPSNWILGNGIQNHGHCNGVNGANKLKSTNSVTSIDWQNFLIFKLHIMAN
ncbi:uncharacterized LOC100210581 isoform X6 [Hydra vulgaris]|uniref:Uncharacterized LOC100210581 isoform X6 n=1 Tax=Hydra vulgaris TaxID=6087 RepID=A0ABM4BFE4_HYDVU